MFILCIGVVLLVSSLGIATYMNNVFAETYGGFLSFFAIGFSSTAGTVGGLGAAKLIADRIRKDKLEQQIEKEKLEHELRYLKAQVNPHTLFNAINSIYVLIEKDAKLAGDTLIRLSNLLRFQLYECSADNISIEQELEYLTNFIELEKIRKGKKVKVCVEKQGSFSGYLIAPFVLIPFIENAFKHVSMFRDKPNEIKIEFSKDQEKLNVSISNTVDNKVDESGGGIGLKNVSRRLELLYPQQHDLKISKTAELFHINLTLLIS
jgi:two-component system, LytTR family, sensor kinase